MSTKMKAWLELTPSEWRLLIRGLECSADEATTGYEEILNRDLAEKVKSQLRNQEYEEGGYDSLSLEELEEDN